MTEAPIIGKVSDVANNREVMINRGEDAGVSMGLVFMILYPEILESRDPDSNKVIGKYRRTKVPVRVVEVSESLCIARTFRQVQVNVGGTGMGVGNLFAPPKIESRPERFSVKETAFGNDNQIVVSPGDPVVSTSHEGDYPSTVLWPY